MDEIKGNLLKMRVVAKKIAEITDHLYLCGVAALSRDELESHGITCIMNMATELDTSKHAGNGIDYVHYAMDDVSDEDLLSHMDECVDFIYSVHKKGGRIVVHCIAGVSRSASICLAYLMKHYRWSLRKAFLHVQALRPVIRPNNGFWRQLIVYEERVLGTSSVQMVPFHSVWLPDVYRAEMKERVVYDLCDNLWMLAFPLFFLLIDVSAVLLKQIM